MNITLRIIISAALFLLVFLTGIWLSRSGRPLNAGVFAAHKLVGLAAGVILLVTLYQRHRQVPLSGPEWIAVAVSGLCFLGTVVSGGFLSTDEPVSPALTRLHQLLPVLAVISSAVTLYLVLGL